MLRKLFLMFVAASHTLLMVPIACIAMLVTWNTSTSIWIARRLWAPVLLKAGGARLEVLGVENVDPRRPTIYVSNHQSTIDIPALLLAIPVDLRFVVKEELKYVPVLGWYLKVAKFIFVDRKNSARAIQSLTAASKRIRKGISIIIYAEGTRSNDGRMLPFKKGPFALALQAGVAICPVTVEGSGKIMPKNSWDVVPGVIRIKIGAPLDPSRFGPNDREGLTRAVRDIMIAQSLELGGLGGARSENAASDSEAQAVQ